MKSGQQDNREGRLQRDSNRKSTSGALPGLVRRKGKGNKQF